MISELISNMASRWVQCNNWILLRSCTLSIQATINHTFEYFQFKIFVSWLFCAECSINDSFQNKSDKPECSHIIWWSTVLLSRSLLQAVFKDKQRHFAALSDCVFVYLNFVFVYLNLYLCKCVCLRQFSKINRDTLPHSDALRLCIDVHLKVPPFLSFFSTKSTKQTLCFRNTEDEEEAS